MGWARCGKDSLGRPIGYAYRAKCDEPGCREQIDRGLAYACGGMHGAGENFCERYFCAAHLYFADLSDADRERGDPVTAQLCRRCTTSYEARHRPRDQGGATRGRDPWAV